jgi:hypothetical protein
MPDVGDKRVEQADAARLSHILRHLGDPAKRDQGVATGEVGIRAAGDPCGDVLLEMKRQLVIEFTIRAVAPEQRAPSLRQIGPE